MNKYKCYFTRANRFLQSAEREEYEENIVSSGLHEDERKLQNLFKDCFSHHVSPYVDPLNADLVVLDKDRERYIPKDILSSNFIKYHYVEPLIYNTSSLSKEERESHKVSLDEFINLISGNPITTTDFSSCSIGSNKISYLIGDVGEGKSALITKTISNIKSIYLQREKLVPVYIDFESKYITAENDKRVKS